eukprot:TRINITY_DN13541_c0_g1_i3.p1 TRINITY_DN13541_c0_g1~~TRINITY_DN13541_c0_g1_i3.p1  ORF type:complete len:339 (+),score=59.64 TRINITY_DN13541_c0_g1_i3:66-1019(+)
MPELDLAEQVFDIALHPAEDIIACGTIDGRVTIHRYAPAGHTQLVESKHHSGSVRSVAYTADGSVLFTGSADKSVAALDPTGAVKWHRKGAHDAAVNRIFPVGDSVHLVASGDDAGGVKLWDARAAATAKPVMAVAVNTDFISDMACDRAAAFLLATSGDATLSVFDLRANKLAGRSDDQEDELLSVQSTYGLAGAQGRQEGRVRHAERRHRAVVVGHVGRLQRPLPGAPAQRRRAVEGRRGDAPHRKQRRPHPRRLGAAQQVSGGPGGPRGVPDRAPRAVAQRRRRRCRRAQLDRERDSRLESQVLGCVGAQRRRR